MVYLFSCRSRNFSVHVDMRRYAVLTYRASRVCLPPAEHDLPFVLTKRCEVSAIHAREIALSQRDQLFFSHCAPSWHLERPALIEAHRTASRPRSGSQVRPLLVPDHRAEQDDGGAQLAV